MTARPRVYGYEEGMPSKTKQEFKDECDVNTIVDMYVRGAPLPVQITKGQFVDVSELGDYKTAIDTVMQAEEVFNKMPKAIKEAVGNSVAGFLDFVNDPENEDQLVELGLVAAEEPAEDDVAKFARLTEAKEAAAAAKEPKEGTSDP